MKTKVETVGQLKKLLESYPDDKVVALIIPNQAWRESIDLFVNDEDPAYLSFGKEYPF